MVNACRHWVLTRLTPQPRRATSPSEPPQSCRAAVAVARHAAERLPNGCWGLWADASWARWAVAQRWVGTAAQGLLQGHLVQRQHTAPLPGRGAAGVGAWGVAACSAAQQPCAALQRRAVAMFGGSCGRTAGGCRATSAVQTAAAVAAVSYLPAGLAVGPTFYPSGTGKTYNQRRCAGRSDS